MISLWTSASKCDTSKMNPSTAFSWVYASKRQENQDKAISNMQNLKGSTSYKHKIREHRLSRYYACHQLFLGVSYTGNAVIPYASLLCLLKIPLPSNAPLTVFSTVYVRELRYLPEILKPVYCSTLLQGIGFHRLYISQTSASIDTTDTNQINSIRL